MNTAPGLYQQNMSDLFQEQRSVFSRYKKVVVHMERPKINITKHPKT